MLGFTSVSTCSSFHLKGLKEIRILGAFDQWSSYLLISPNELNKPKQKSICKTVTQCYRSDVIKGIRPKKKVNIFLWDQIQMAAFGQSTQHTQGFVQKRLKTNKPCSKYTMWKLWMCYNTWTEFMCLEGLPVGSAEKLTERRWTLVFSAQEENVPISESSLQRETWHQTTIKARFLLYNVINLLCMCSKTTPVNNEDFGEFLPLFKTLTATLCTTNPDACLLSQQINEINISVH